ncbi:MAG: hypothetical protein FJ398_13485 [Verrucomicrobia bacterium]|nr:hypothetical protein [Verrucomicrobiota bacterium]
MKGHRSQLKKTSNREWTQIQYECAAPSRARSKAASHEPVSRTVAFRPLQRSTPGSARKQPEGCGPHGLRFMGRVHGSGTMEAPMNQTVRASLSPASRSGRVPCTSSGSPGRTRPTGFMGRVHGSETKRTSHEAPPSPSPVITRVQVT